MADDTGEVINIVPDGLFTFESEEELLPLVFQKLHRKGDIDYWMIGGLSQNCVNWKREGF
jgi:hypothetical protein